MIRTDDIKVCDECFCVSLKEQHECQHCGYVFKEFTIKPERFMEIWVEIFNLANHYTLPPFKLTDHLKDCYGWAYCEARP